MRVIVTDAGFAPPHPDPDGPADQTGPAVLWLASDSDPETLTPDLWAGVARICVAFGGMTDGRGLTLARRLRDLGYGGVLRAVGPLIADQYLMLRRAGFDQVDIPADLAARQPWPQWQRQIALRAGPSHQDRLRQAGAGGDPFI